jgi:WD40 repeat protein
MTAKIMSKPIGGDWISNEKFLIKPINKNILVMDVNTKETIIELKGHINEVTVIDFSPNNKFLASGCYDGLIRIWDLGTMKNYKTFFSFRLPIGGILWKEDNKKLVVYTKNQLKILSLDGEKPITIDNSEIKPLKRNYRNSYGELRTIKIQPEIINLKHTEEGLMIVFNTGDEKKIEWDC